MRLDYLLSALLLPAASVVAQTTTSSTTDVNYPTILSAVGNVTGLPGGNEFCGDSRIRKPWGALTSDEQALYLEATELAIANGGVEQFAAITTDSLSEAQGEYSCGFFTWHRRLLLAYESYLRDLDERFACLTLPYYDVHTAYIQSVNGECNSMFECSGIFQALGGNVNSTDQTETLTLNGVEATGYAVSGAPYEEACDDDNNCGFMVRDDLSSKQLPSAASFGTFQSAVATSGDYATFLENIQFGVHNEVLDAVGGAFATSAAARDILYYSWYAAVDMYLHVYHLCRIGVPLTYEQILESLEVYSNATQTCGGVDGVDATSALIMRINVDGKTVDATQHPTLGQYFGYVGSDNWNYVDIQQLGDYSYTYQLPEVLRQQILSNNDMCTGFNRAFAATYTTLDAAAVKRTTTTKTTTKTTTTKTTKIVNGKKVTTTKVTKVITKANSTTSSSAKSTVTSGQLVSGYGYSYLGNFSTNDASYGEGTLVSNGYTGYTAYYSNGAITTKHNGIVSANYSSSSSASSSSTTSTAARMDATYSNTSTVKMNVTVGTSSVARNVTVSVATSGTYWAWLQTAYNGLFTRFEGNVDLVTSHLKLLECYTFDKVYGISNYTTAFMDNKNLVTDRVECGQRLDLVKSGLLQMAVRSSDYTAKSLTFASSTVIKTIRTTYKRTTTRKVTYIKKSYTQKVQKSLDSTQQALGNITVTSTSGSGDDETSTTVVDTGYIASNTTSTTQQSAKNATAVTTTSSTTTTTTTAANVSETLSEASSGSTELDVSGSASTTSSEGSGTTTASSLSNSESSEEGSSTTMTGSNGQTTTTGSNGETTTITATGSGGSIQTTTTGSGGSIETTTTGSGATTTTYTTGSGTKTTTTGKTTTTTSGTTSSTSGGSTTTTTTGSGASTTTGTSGTTGSTTTTGATTTTSGGNNGSTTTTTAGTTTTTTGSNGETTTTTTGSNGETTTTTTTGSGGSIQTTTAGSGGSIETTTTGSGATTTTHTTGPICSGSGDLPTGSLCPVKGDIAVQDCHDTLSSWTKDGTCVAPADATCEKIKTGAWGCVYDSAFTPASTKTTTEAPTPAPTTTSGNSTPAPTKTGTETEKPTPAPTTKETEKPTPAPTTTKTEKPTPAPTTTETEKPTPAPTTKDTEKPTPVPTTTETEKPTPAPTTEESTPAPTTPCPEQTPAPTTESTPAPTTGTPTTESPTPSPTTESPGTESPTPCPTTETPSTEVPTPCPTTDMPSTDAPTPCPTTVAPATDVPTPYPTTATPEVTTPCP
ncbi:hypothetical protein JM18_008936, partial [Phytophthora kernoviae]